MSVSYVYCNRCKCINCSLENVVQHEECRCCMEVDRCRERRAEVKKDDFHFQVLKVSVRIVGFWLLQQ